MVHGCGIEQTAKIYGTSVKDVLTKVGFYTNLEWLTGFSNFPATQGIRPLNQDPDDPNPFKFIEWSRNIEDGTAKVKYTNIASIAPANCSYIHCGKTNVITYNRLINVGWNYEGHFGRVKDPMHFGDEIWYCWDENLYDTLCPE
jgi:hypothetical protein